jgi:hypothetical protein
MMSLSSLCWTRKEQRRSVLTLIGDKIKPKGQVVFYNRLTQTLDSRGTIVKAFTMFLKFKDVIIILEG